VTGAGFLNWGTGSLIHWAVAAHLGIRACHHGACSITGIATHHIALVTVLTHAGGGAFGATVIHHHAAMTNLACCIDQSGKKEQTGNCRYHYH
jgi:hypothetical protein